jgi:2-methylcitrate dehydratase PrpD
VETYQAALDLCDRPTPTTDYEAKFSLQHCAAAALTRPQVDFAAFGPEARTALAPLRDKVRCRAAEPYTSAYPTAWGCTVTVTLNDGQIHWAEREHTKGDPEAPLSRQEMLAKARLLLEFGGIDDADALITPVLELKNDGALPRLALD